MGIFSSSPQDKTNVRCRARNVHSSVSIIPCATVYIAKITVIIISTHDQALADWFVDSYRYHRAKGIANNFQGQSALAHRFSSGCFTNKESVLFDESTSSTEETPLMKRFVWVCLHFLAIIDDLHDDE